MKLIKERLKKDRTLFGWTAAREHHTPVCKQQRFLTFQCGSGGSKSCTKALVGRSVLPRLLFLGPVDTAVLPLGLWFSSVSSKRDLSSIRTLKFWPDYRLHSLIIPTAITFMVA